MTCCGIRVNTPDRTCLTDAAPTTRMCERELSGGPQASRVSASIAGRARPIMLRLVPARHRPSLASVPVTANVRADTATTLRWCRVPHWSKAISLRSVPGQLLVAAAARGRVDRRGERRHLPHGQLPARRQVRELLVRVHQHSPAGDGVT